MRPDYKVERPAKSNWRWAAVAVSVRNHYPVSTKYTQCRLAEIILGQRGCCEVGEACNLDHSLQDALTQLGHFERVGKAGLDALEASDITARKDLLIFQHGPKGDALNRYYVVFECGMIPEDPTQFYAVTGDVQTGKIEDFNYEVWNENAQMHYVTTLGR